MKIKKNTVAIYTLILFVISATTVFFIFPRGKQFNYDYSLGTPWLHEDLIAPCDFPVYKTEPELNAEKDSIVKTFIPYYIKDTNIYNSYSAAIKRDMSALESEIFNSLNLNSEIGIFELEQYRRELINYFKAFDNLILTCVQSGIISIPDSVKNPIQFRFYLYQNGVSELSYGYEYLTEKQCVEKFENLYLEIKSVDSIFGYKLRNILNQHKTPVNIVYDSGLSKKILSNKLASVSPVIGMIQKGELIIKKGSIVGENESNVIESLKKQQEDANQGVNEWKVSTGTALIFFAFFMVIFLYVISFHSEYLKKFKDITYFTLQILLMVLLVYVIFRTTELNIYIIPFALFPLLLYTFYGFQISFSIYLFSLLIVGFFAPNSFEFLFVQMLAGLVAMYSMKNKMKRRQIFITMSLVFLTYAISVTGFLMIKQREFSYDIFNEYIPYGISSFLILMYLPLVYVFEKTFGFISDFTLMELSDTNNPALRILAEKAPGTFQHSVQVANLVESVVRELGGDYLLARTGALYHDIGKSHHPEYFIENQSGKNVHDQFDFEESAQKIISHVDAGVELGRKYKLPQQVIDYISMHHGTSVTRYFYNSWVNANPDNAPVLANFQYPGPKPTSIETAVMMMADSVEAASRTLTEYTPESIEKSVSKIIDSQLNDGQFENVEITLKQLKRAKEIFSIKIQNIYHARVIYPELNKKDKS
ncbi:MAG TPA: HDIG domain-containing protein [Bacteroidales bacterium]|nr:HDIG domain-containing protein [Bacteroidales bacterium]